MKLLNVDTNAKTVKGQKDGFLTGVLYLAPARLSGYEVCPQRSAGCTAACLNTAGRGALNNVQQSRIRKTKEYFSDRAGFMAQLHKEIAALIRKADREGLTPVVRLNGTSDIPWERIGLRVDGVQYANLMSAYPDIQFYDYTKVTRRAIAHAQGKMPDNYHITFSATEDNEDNCAAVLSAGGNVAVVFAEIPDEYDMAGTMCPPVRVIDGDADDLRFKDRARVQGLASIEHAGVIVGLKAKGKARKDTSGFVR